MRNFYHHWSSTFLNSFVFSTYSTSPPWIIIRRLAQAFVPTCLFSSRAHSWSQWCLLSTRNVLPFHLAFLSADRLHVLLMTWAILAPRILEFSMPLLRARTLEFLMPMFRASVVAAAVGPTQPRRADGAPAGSEASGAAPVAVSSPGLGTETPGAAGSLGPPQLLDNAPPTNTRTGRHETARYGLRACRIGEASHPGPSNRLFTATFLFEWLVIATCMVGRAAEAHKAVQGRDAATFAQSCRSRHEKRERRETARRIQWERACFELECRWAFATPRISRGTVRLVMTHPEFHVLAVGMPRRRSVFTRALMRRQHHYFAPSPTQLSRCGPSRAGEIWPSSSASRRSVTSRAAV